MRIPHLLAGIACVWATSLPAYAYQVCKIVPPRAQPSCLVHFAEGDFSISPGTLAARELEACLKRFQYAHDLQLIGHADACSLDVAEAVRLTGAKVITSRDTGNSLLGEKRIDAVADAASALYARAGVRGGITVWTENRADEDSRGHDSDDRSVEIRPRAVPGCPKNPQYTYLVDGSGSMESAWPSIAGLGFPADSCIYLVTDGNCPASLAAYRPYGSTNAVTEAARFIREGRTRGLVVLSDFDQPTARKDDVQLVRRTASDPSSGMTLVPY